MWPSRDINEVEMFTLDIHPNKDDELVLLVAAMNLTHTPQILFALVTLVEQQSCFAIKDFCQMKTNAFYSGDANNEESLKYKFIMTDTAAFVYGEKSIFEVLLNGTIKFNLLICCRIETNAFFSLNLRCCSTGS